MNECRPTLDRQLLSTDSQENNVYLMVVKSIPDWKTQIWVNMVHRTTLYPFKTVRKVLGKKDSQVRFRETVALRE